MFKKLIILVLATLLVLIAATEQPTTPATTPATTPNVTPENPDKTTPTPTTPEGNSGPAVEEVISVSEFIQKALNNEYKQGDNIVISGTVLTQEIGVGTYGFEYLITLGPETKGHVVWMKAGPSQTEKGQKSYISFSDASPRPGDEVVVRAKFWRIDYKSGQRVQVYEPYLVTE